MSGQKAVDWYEWGKAYMWCGCGSVGGNKAICQCR